jgi:hypothetical protein
MKIKSFLLIIALLLTSCGKPESEVGDGDPVVPHEIPEQDGQTGVESCEENSDPTEEPEEIKESVISEEIPLANGAVLFIEHGEHEWDASIVSIQLDEDREPMFLLRDFRSRNYRISPDGAKIAYIIHDSDNLSGILNIFDVTEQKNTIPEFADYIKPEETMLWNETRRILWLDNEILLVIDAVWHATWSRGGSVHYYNITDGSNGKIIPHDINIFQIVDFEIKGDELNLTIMLNSGNAYERRLDDICRSVSIAKIYELIENGNTLILDIPAFEEAE